MRNADSWGLAFIVVGTAAVMWTLPDQAPRGLISASVKPVMAVPQGEVAYKITVSTSRMPAECKALDSASPSDLVASCQSISTREAQMTMTPVDEKIQLATKP
jgi:hypothetical protein